MRDDLNSIMRNKFILEYISEIETNQLKRIQKDLIDDIYNNTFSDNFGEVLQAVTKELEKRNNEYNKPQEHVSSQQIQPQGHVFSPKPTDQNSLKGSSDASTLQEDLKELYLGKKSPDVSISQEELKELYLGKKSPDVSISQEELKELYLDKKSPDVSISQEELKELYLDKKSPDVSISQEDLKQLNLDKKSYENIIKRYKDNIEKFRSDTDITDEIKNKLIANEEKNISEYEQILNDIEEKINVSNKKDRQIDAPYGIASGDEQHDETEDKNIGTSGLGQSSNPERSDGEVAPDYELDEIKSEPNKFVKALGKIARFGLGMALGAGLYMVAGVPGMIALNVAGGITNKLINNAIAKVESVPPGSVITSIDEPKKGIRGIADKVKKSLKNPNTLRNIKTYILGAMTGATLAHATGLGTPKSDVGTINQTTQTPTNNTPVNNTPVNNPVQTVAQTNTPSSVDFNTSIPQSALDTGSTTAFGSLNGDVVPLNQSIMNDGNSIVSQWVAMKDGVPIASASDIQSLANQGYDISDIAANVVRAGDGAPRAWVAASEIVGGRKI